ncbi:MAG: toxin-antitoxin system HicB family antitoxin, partial [bacterium]
SRYLKIVEWSDEDKCFVGTCPGLFFGGVHGNNEKKVYSDLCDAVEDTIKTLKKEGYSLPDATAQKKFSGIFNLRIGKELHRYIYIKARQAGESINSYCKHLLSASLGR